MSGAVGDELGAPVGNHVSGPDVDKCTIGAEDIGTIGTVGAKIGTVGVGAKAIGTIGAKDIGTEESGANQIGRAGAKACSGMAVGAKVGRTVASRKAQTAMARTRDVICSEPGT